jgi:Dolichyl-phosphate-mannose-protein mannosyltransferase
VRTPKSAALLLGALTLFCLLPFSGKAFNVDDPLFLWSAQHIAEHPLDPYGFHALWDKSPAPMSEITKNPPLACYYAAAVGSIAGWSERALHLGFLLPALAVVLGTYRLALRLTSSPGIAAASTLLTPGIMVSATSVMCDTLMLAFWIWAIVFWLEGFEPADGKRLAASAILMGAAALTKYFGLCVVPLLFVYSFQTRRRFGAWAWFFGVPVLALAAYQLWTSSLYGHRMVFDAVGFTAHTRWEYGAGSILANGVVCASFVGGCALSAAALAPLVWSAKQIAIGVLFGLLAGPAIAIGWVSVGAGPQNQLVQLALHDHWEGAGAQLALFIAGGIAVLSLAVADVRKRRDAESTFLAAWIFGTFCFAAAVNWTINARSVLPLIPAAGILLARRLDACVNRQQRAWRIKLAAALIASGLVSMWVTAADAEWADSQRDAAGRIVARLANQRATVWFQGHWGFQYYMQRAGQQPFDFATCTLNPDDLLVVPVANVLTHLPPQKFVRSRQLLELKLRNPWTTMRLQSTAGFYGSFYGPLPFAFGPLEPEKYLVYRMGATMTPEQWRSAEPSAASSAPL